MEEMEEIDELTSTYVVKQVRNKIQCWFERLPESGMVRQQRDPRMSSRKHM